MHTQLTSLIRTDDLTKHWVVDAHVGRSDAQLIRHHDYISSKTVN